MAAARLSKAAINRAGDRLRDDAVPRPEDVAVYNAYVESLAVALAEVSGVVRSVSARGDVAVRFKRLESAIAKLRRGNFKLSQIQDIAGCRLLVADLEEQDRALGALLAALDCRRVTDYRITDHISGYVAVHMLCRAGGDKPVEVQIRTRAQHTWALTSERLSKAASVGIDIKYGLGPAEVRAPLQALSKLCRQYDSRIAAGDSDRAFLTGLENAIKREVDVLLRAVDNEGGEA